MKKYRIEKEPVIEKQKRQQRDKEAKRKSRSSSSELKRLQKFRENTRYGPIFTCTVCDQNMFLKNTNLLTEDYIKEVESKYPDLSNLVFQKKHMVKVVHKVFNNFQDLKLLNQTVASIIAIFSLLTCSAPYCPEQVPAPSATFQKCSYE